MDKYEVLPSNCFSFICRTCLMHHELFAIDEVSWEGIDLKEILSSWTPLEREDYCLPKQMCISCIKHMYQIYSFLSKCKYSEQVLKNILLEPQVSQNSETDISDNYRYVSLGENNKGDVKDDTEQLDTNDCDDMIKTDPSIFNYDNENNRTMEETGCNNYSDDNFTDDNGFLESGDISGDINAVSATENIDKTFIKTEIFKIEEMGTQNMTGEFNLDTIQNIKCDIKEMVDKIRSRKVENLNKVKEHKLKGPPYTCYTCDATFPTREEVFKHKNDTHKKFFKFICEICDSKFQNSSQLEAHVRIHTGEKPFKCEVCDDRFSFKSVWKRHVLTHLDVKPHRCRYCDKEFIRKHVLDQHVRLHTGERLLCRFCGSEFKTPKGLTHHEKNVHPAIQNVPTSITEFGYQCDLCGNILQSEITLSEHVLLHGPRNFQCQICPKNFATNERLQLHQRMAHDDSVFPCHICDKKYKQKSGLMSHLESHRENKFSCDHCGKQFIYKISLRQHMRIHTGDTKYQCKECSLIFPNSRSLETHMKVHNNGKSYICDECGKSFVVKTNLVNHKKIHEANKKSYTCNVCEEAFVSINILKEHISTNH